jgi:site-specific recombinase XerD
VTHLRKLMLDEIQRRNYAQSTAVAYIHALKELAAYYHRPPDQLGPKEISQFQLHLLRDRRLSPQTVKQHMAAMRFFFVHTLKRHYPPGEFRYPKTPQRLPIILSQEEVRRMIDAATNLLHRTLLMTLYSTGMRRAELIRLKVSDIDSQRMVIHIRQGKGSKDRDVPLSPKLLETLREYWRWMKPQSYLFPGQRERRTKNLPLSTKAVYLACREAACRAGIRKIVGPHTLRHSFATHLLESGADLHTIQLLLGHADLRHTVVYLHLSQRHLHACPNPLDALAVSDLSKVSRSRRNRKP